MIRHTALILGIFLAMSTFGLAQESLPDGAIARVGSVKLRHQGAIVQMAFLADNELAALDDRGIVRVWDSTSGQERRSFVRLSHGAGVASDIHELIRRELMIERRVRFGGKMGIAELIAAENPGLAVKALSPDGKLLADAGPEKVVLWDMAVNKAIRSFAVRQDMEKREEGGRKGDPGMPLRPVAFSADGKLLASGSGFGNGFIQIWETGTGKELHALRVPQDRPIVRLFFSPAGTTLIGQAVDQVLVWDLKKGKRIRTYQHSREALTALALSADGKRFATAGEDDKILLWEEDSEEQAGRIATSRERGTISLAFSHDGKFIASGGNDNQIRIYDVESSKEIKALEGHQAPVCNLVFSSDGKLLASADGQGHLRIWNAGKWTEQVKAENAGRIIFAAVQAKGTVLLADSTGGSRLAELLTGKVKRKSEGQPVERPLQVYSADGQFVALVGEEKEGAVRICEGATGKELCVLKGVTAAGHAAFSPDGKRLAILHGENASLGLFDTKTGEQVMPLSARADGLLFTPDGRSLLAMQSSGQALLIELATGKVRFRFQASFGDMHMMAVSPDGKLLVGAAGEILRVWNLSTGKIQRGLVGHTADVTAVAWSHNGNKLASASVDGQVRVWDLAKGESLQVFSGHRDAVHCLAFAPDSKLLVSGSADGTALVWDVEAPRLDGGKTPAAVKLEALWEDLASDDAEVAYVAQTLLIDKSDEAVKFLGQKLTPAAKANAEEIGKLIKALDHRRFQIRDQAIKDLAQLGGQAEASLKKALADKPSEETKQRIEQLLEGIKKPTAGGDELRSSRAIETLEKIGAQGALEHLRKLADGAPGARLTEEARAAVERMQK